MFRPTPGRSVGPASLPYIYSRLCVAALLALAALLPHDARAEASGGGASLTTSPGGGGVLFTFAPE
ncbi:MAG TPA: hypothetical protein VM490_13380, partial [Armatimonadaceae bacterium]|nr:hypothetical protein [Armatimonadaceae bacterium]